MAILGKSIKNFWQEPKFTVISIEHHYSSVFIELANTKVVFSTSEFPDNIIDAHTKKIFTIRTFHKY